jgi:sugar transferase (PEP-CTERM/EpsH1 system associated)
MGVDPTGRRLKLLLLTTKPPFPLTDGGRIAVYEPLRRLAARGHQVTLLTFRAPGQDQDALAHLETLCRVEYVQHDTRTRPGGMISNLFSSLPYSISKYRSPLMMQKLREMLTGEAFDVVHLEQVHLACYQEIVRGEFGVPAVLRQVNSESHLAERFWQTQTGLRRIYARLQATRLRRYEAEMCARMDCCLAITAGDAERLRTLSPQANIRVIPAGVDLEEFQPAPHLAEAEAVVFVGSMDWLPNADAVLWFAKEISPLVKREFPAFQFYVVGRQPPVEIRRLTESDAIHVTGYVDDVRAYLARAAICVIPLRVGGGMRVKLLQAMAMAKPVVSTSIGAEGIAIEHGRHVLLADTASDFASGVVSLLRNRGLREYLGQNARRLVAEHYSWEVATDLLEQAYMDVVSAARVARAATAH